MRVEGSDESLVIGTQQQGNSFSGNGGGEVIDLRFTSGLAADTKSVNADFVVNREAAFNNFVGFYKVTDTNGGIDINGDGVADFTPGQSGYITAAVQNRVAGIDLAVSNQGRASFTGKTFDSNSIFAPFIIVNGNTSSFTDSNTSNDPAVYFSYLGANTDGVDHIRLLGSNTFGFEDLAGGGDRDFNDIIVKATLTAVK
jgi:3-phytase